MSLPDDGSVRSGPLLPSAKYGCLIVCLIKQINCVCSDVLCVLNKFVPHYLRCAPYLMFCIYILVKLGSAALVGSQFRRTTPIRKPTSARCAGQTRRVTTLGPWTCVSIQKPCPSHGSIAPMRLRKILEPEARRTLRQQIYSFEVATVVLAL